MGEDVYGEELAYAMALNRVVEDGDSVEQAAKMLHVDPERLRAECERDPRVRVRAALDRLREWRVADRALAKTKAGMTGYAVERMQAIYDDYLIRLRAAADELMKEEKR